MFRPSLLRLIGLIAIVFGLLGLLRFPPPWTASAIPSSVERTVPYTDLNPLGANLFLEREVEDWKKRAALQMAREGGFGWLTLHMPWASLELRPGRFFSDAERRSTWEKYDTLVSLAEEYGFRIVLRLDRPPAWARPENPVQTAPPSDLEDYGNFVATVAARYRGRIQHYQIWNEPNITIEWGDQPIDASAYARLLAVAARRIRTVDPDALIVSAPLAQTLERSRFNLSELEYLEALYVAGFQNSADIVMANAYGFDRPPEDPPAETALNFRRLELLRAVMERHNDGAKPVWVAEFGWNASPPTFPAERLIWRRVSEAEQAEYAVRAVRLARSWGWVGVMNLWYFRQVGDYPVTSPVYYFRLVDVDFTPRLGYGPLAELSNELRRAGPGMHQETSPAVEEIGTWSAALLSGVDSNTVLRSSRPGDKLRFTFAGSGVALVHSVGPTQGRFIVTIDGQPPPGLPRDEQDRAYLDLYGPTSETGRQSFIARDLRAGRHVLELVIDARADPRAQDREATVDGFAVELRWSPLQFYQAAVAAAAGLLLLLFARRVGRG